MDHLAPQFDRERQAIEKARQALAKDPESPLAGAFGEFLEEYESLLERAGRVAELAMAAQDDLESAMAQVAQLSQSDGLTGAMNRRSFERVLARDWAQAQREGTPLSMLIVNVDLFRSYNDIYGSLPGDDCLKYVAQTVMRCLYREVDVVARMEGDTFVALLPGTDPPGAKVVAERIVAGVRAMEVPHLESPHGGVVTVSVGVSTMAPQPGEAPMLLVREAQAALGRAKDEGRNAVAQHPAA